MRLQYPTPDMLSDLTEEEVQSIIETGKAQRTGPISIGGPAGSWGNAALDRATDLLSEADGEDDVRSELFNLWWVGVLVGYTLFQLQQLKPKVVH